MDGSVVFASGRQCASHIESQKWLPWQRPSAPLDPNLTHNSYSPFEPTTQTAFQSVQPFSHKGPQSNPILYNGTPLSPSKLPILVGDLDSHLILGSSDPPDASLQPKRHLDRFSRFCRAH